MSVSVRATGRTAEGVTVFICQESHSSVGRSVTIAAAETISQPRLPLFSPPAPHNKISDAPLPLQAAVSNVRDEDRQRSEQHSGSDGKSYY